MGLFTSTLQDALKKRFKYGEGLVGGDGGIVSPAMEELIQAVQEGLEEHDHSGGGAGTGTGAAIVDLGALAAADATEFLPAFISADADGRALMEADLFDEATLEDKIEDDAFTEAVIDGKVAADAINAEKLKPATLTGEKAAVVAESNTVPGMLLVHHILADQAGGADKDVVVVHKVLVLDVIVQNKAAGGAGDTITVKNGATAITDDIDTNKADKLITRAASIDDAASAIAALGTLRVSKANGANDANCDVFVVCMRVA